MNEDADMRYLDSALRQEVGGEHAPDLSARIAAASARSISAGPVRRRITVNFGRRAPLGAPSKRRSPLAAVIAALLLLVAVGFVGFAINTNREPHPFRDLNEAKGQPQPAANATSPSDETPRSPQPAPVVVPHPTEVVPPAIDPEQPRPEQTPKPQPLPEGEVKKPDGKPAPIPEAPRNPEGTEVRKPEAGTGPTKKPEVEAPALAEVAVVKELSRKNALKARYAESESWRNVEAGEVLNQGVKLSASGHADLSLSRGGLLRFSGTLSLSLDGALVADLGSEDLYVDNLDAPAMTVRGGGVSASVQGVAMFDVTRTSLGIACIQGEVVTAQGNLVAGKSGTLSLKGLSKVQAVNIETLVRKHACLRSLPQRVLMREDFDAIPDERIDEGSVSKGVGVSSENPAGVAFYLPKPISLRAGDVIRFRYRVSRALEEFLVQLGTADRGNFRKLLTPARIGEWVEVEVALCDLVRTLDRTEKIAPGTVFKTVQVWAHCPQACKLEVDWVEIVRRPADG